MQTIHDDVKHRPDTTGVSPAGGTIRIAFIIDTINSIGGTEKQLLGLIKHLDKERFEAYLLCLKPPNAYVHLDIGSMDDYRSHCSYHELDIQSLASLKCIGRIFRLVRFLREKRIDIIQTYFIDAQLIGVIAGRLAGTKRIVCCRRDLGFWHEPHLLFLVRSMNIFADGFLVNSLAIRDQISRDERIDPRKISAIRNGIELSAGNESLSPRSTTEGPEDGRSCFSVGISANFTRQVKRVDVFIRAAALVLKDIPDVRFCIAGEGNLREELTGLCRELGISENVVFLGALTNVHDVLKGWDIGVLSSDSEGMSNSILEYMASGIPVVATAVGGNRELIEEGVNGFLVPRGDHVSMAARICRLLKDQDLRKRMGDQGKRIISERYDWEIVKREYESFYLDILGYGR